MEGTLPEPFAGWFAGRGWSPRPHQLAMLAAARSGESVLLIAPTGGGKTLAGFLPSLLDLHEKPRPGLHTLYVSPLKALATDIARNLTSPVAEMSLPISIETRTGDTPANRRARQRETPPNLLLTTPESLAVLLSSPGADAMFAGLASVVVDEVHALAGTKRGDQLALCLARLATLAPGARRVGLSATIAHPDAIAAYIGARRRIEAPDGVPPAIAMMLPEGRLPWSGHMGLDGAPEIMERIRAAAMTIVFVNTRAQAELIFQALWKLNAETLPIALHHGSLEVAQRRRVEAAMAAGSLRAVVATSSLDLGIDWGGIDQVIQVGAPKGVSRLLQRVGRANHRMDEASRAILVPANRFEVLECEAAMLGVAAGELDGDPPRPGGLDVLAQHLLLMACSAPFHPDAMYAEIAASQPYAGLSRGDFDDVLRFVEDGGYALAAYERWKKLFRDSEGRVHVRSERVARQARMNIGTIVEAPMIKVRLAGKRGFGPVLGEVEEYFVNLLSPGDTFMFAGRLLRFLRLREMAIEVAEGGSGDPMVPAYEGARMPLTTNLADRVRGLLQRPADWHLFPEPVQEWLRLQKRSSRLPGRSDLLVETFPRGDRWYLVAYCFEGRNAHQTLGMLVTRRMERFGMAPLGFVATDYVLGIWSANQPTDVARLFEQDILGDDVEAWMADSSMLRRTFRNVAVIAGLIERHHPGAEKNRRQVTVNSDLIYDVLRRHQPDHILLRATRADAASGLTDLGRIAAMLARVKGRITHMALSRVSPLAVPVLLDIGRESVRSGDDEEALLAEAEAALVAEATGEAEPPGPTSNVPAIHRRNVERGRRRDAQLQLFPRRRA
ncbi:MAG: ligase-associated DNA damage response DEXH box helicase [Alphaproteobacteria bacterium]|nr:ligase-associated DNA damage response DEXH box helicase [Alphaproteobacteria bacterium]